MKRHTRDNLSKFFYDAAKLSLAMLVFGAIGRQPFSWLVLVGGVSTTLSLTGFGVMMDFIPAEKEI